MPWEWTEVPYCAPVCHTLVVKKPQPLIRIAGHAFRTRTTRMKASISIGISAPPRPIQRTKEPLRAQRRNADPAGPGGGQARFPPLATGANESMAQWNLAVTASGND